MYRSTRMLITLIFIGVFNSLPAMTIEKMAKWKSLLNQNNPEIVAQFYNNPGGHEAVKAVFKELNHEAQVTIVCWLAIQKASKTAGLQPTTQGLAQQIADLAPLSPPNPILTDEQKRSLHIGFFYWLSLKIEESFVVTYALVQNFPYLKQERCVLDRQLGGIGFNTTPIEYIKSGYGYLNHPNLYQKMLTLFQ